MLERILLLINGVDKLVWTMNLINGEGSVQMHPITGLFRLELALMHEVDQMTNYSQEMNHPTNLEVANKWMTEPWYVAMAMMNVITWLCPNISWVCF